MNIICRLCREIINPTKKLQHYIYGLTIILLLRITLYLLNYFYIQVDNSYNNIFLIVILFEIIMTKYYNFAKILTFIILLCIINNIINLGICFQSNYSTKNNKLKIFYLIYSIFIHCFSINIVFEAYKEMKSIFIEEYENSRSVSKTESEGGLELKDFNDEKNEK